MARTKRGVISNTPITMEMKYPFILSKINVEIFILLNPYFSSITKILYNWNGVFNKSFIKYIEAKKSKDKLNSFSKVSVLRKESR